MEQAVTVMPEGLVYGMPERNYHATPGIGSTRLKMLGKSPLHFKYACQHGMNDTPSLAFGRAYHAMILEPSTFLERYVLPPHVDRRTSEGKRTWAAFELQAGTREIITAEDMKCLEEMRSVLMANPAARWLLGGEGHNEVSGWWTDPDTGAPCKLRADRLRTDGIVVDLKTTTDASPNSMAKSIANFGYHIQQAHYSDGLARLWQPPRGFVFICQESEPPYAVAFYSLDPASIEVAVRERSRLLSRWRACTDADCWPGYPEQVNTITLPAWAFRASENVTPE